MARDTDRDFEELDWTLKNMIQWRSLIADAIRNNSHYEVAETPVINAVMKVVAAQKQRWEAAARLEEVTDWHKRTINEAPHPSDISNTLHAQEKRIKELRAALDGVIGEPHDDSEVTQ